MKKFLNILTWSLLAFFLVPSGLILASWNAVPGDSLYGVKVGLEKTLVSITPSLALQSSLQVNYTERRLAETQQLLADTYRPQETIQSLYNLELQATQTQHAIESVSDPTQKTLLAEQYIDTLGRVASKLEQNRQNLASAPVQQQTQTAPTQQSRTIQQNTVPALQAQPSVVQKTVEQSILQPTTPPTPITQQQSATQKPTGTTQPSVAEPSVTQQITVQPSAQQAPVVQQTSPISRPIQVSPRNTAAPSAPSTAPTAQPTTVTTQILVTQTTINTTIANMHQVKQEAERESRDQEKQRDKIKKSEEKKSEEEKQPDKQSNTETRND